MPSPTRFRHALVLLVAGALVAFTVAPAQAQEEPEADVVSSAVGATTVLGIDAGDLLTLRLIGEDGTADTDSKEATGAATTAISPLTVGSETVPALDALSLPPVETNSTSGEQSQETAAVDLGSVAGGTPGLLGGTINPAALKAVVDAAGARSLLTSSLADVSVLAGLTTLTSSEALLGAASSDEVATAGRNLTVDELTVIDFTGLLALVGLDLSDLPLDTLLGLVDGLGLLPTLGDLLGVELDSIEDLTGLVDGLVAALGATLTDPVCDLAADLILLLGLDCASNVDTIGDTLTEITASLTTVIDGVLAVLDGAALVSLEGFEAGTVAEAAHTVEDSVANVSATLGALRIGGNELPIPVDATVEEVLAVADQAVATLDSILASIDPSLAGLITLDLLEEVTSITEADGVVTAVADLTALRLGITPPDVCALVEGLLGDGLGGTLPGDLELGDLAVPDNPVTGVLGQLGAAVPCEQIDDVTALAGPLAVTAGEISNTAVLGVTIENTPTPPAAPDPTLPATGGDESAMLFGALALLALALGTHRFVRRGSSPQA